MTTLSSGYVQSRVYMDTVVTIEISKPATTPDCEERVEKAFCWFDAVEKHCSRFDPSSELRRLLSRTGEPVAVSPLLFNALDFAFKVSRESQSAFDPTIGSRMEAAGFATNYRSGEATASGVPLGAAGGIDDVLLDPVAGTVTLIKPVVFDLGAVAKGLAMDLAGRELMEASGFAINAGGDVLLHGLNTDNELWRVGVRHPRKLAELFCVLHVTDAAVCTSGDYERRQPEGEGHHILNPKSGRAAASLVSLTAIGPTAMTTDALSTAAFVMGPDRGLEFLANQGLQALAVDAELSTHMTSGFQEYLR